MSILIQKKSNDTNSLILREEFCKKVVDLKVAKLFRDNLPQVILYATLTLFTCFLAAPLFIELIGEWYQLSAKEVEKGVEAAKRSFDTCKGQKMEGNEITFEDILSAAMKDLDDFKEDKLSNNLLHELENAIGKKFPTNAHLIIRKNNLPIKPPIKSFDEICKEFAEIPNPHPQETKHRCLDASSPENLKKNRFRDYLPYNTNRVKLENHSSDYINASHCLDNSAILCQAPLIPEDFYHMIWTKGCSAIAGLATCPETTYSYLPNHVTKTKSFGDYEITIEKNESGNPRYEGHIQITKLIIKKNSTREQKFLTHYMFPYWDDGRGTDAKTIASLARHLLKEKNPVIHCMAGIGRSGTLAAVMEAYRRLSLSEMWSENLVRDVVTSLRNERSGCVQTEEQYEAIYNTLYLLLQEDAEAKAPQK